MEDIKFSVVIPAYNAEKYIITALQSVKGQSYKNYEILITNNGSTDNTLKLIEDYIKANKDIDIKVYSQDNRGISGSRNTGIAAAAGDFICFLDVDDWWYDNKLLEVNKIIKKYPNIDVICHDEIMKTRIFSKPLLYRSLKKPIYEDLLFNGNALSPSATTVRSSTAKEIGGFSMDLKSGEEDYDFWLRLARKGCSFYKLDIVLGEYRCYGDNVSANFEKHSFACINLLERHFEQLIKEKKYSKSYIKKKLKKRKSMEYCSIGRRYAKINDRKNSYIYYKKSISENIFYYKSYVGILLNLLKM